MVALLQPTHIQPARPSLSRRPASAAPARSHLRLVEAPTRSASLLRNTDPLSVVGVAAVMLVMLLVVMVRGVQGAPPADSWSGLVEPAAITAAASAGDASTITVVEGDTWSSVAARVAPGADPVEFARSLAAVNGGYQLVAGQVLVVPASG